jgi:hypothetical protein
MCPAMTPSPADRLRALAVPALLAAVALVQIAAVETRGMTRWKAGGFGMYSEPHYSWTQVWIGVPAPEGLRFRLFGKELQGSGVGGMHGLVTQCRRWPTEACLRELSRALPEHVAAIQLWRPRVDPNTFAYQRERLAELRQ